MRSVISPKRLGFVLWEPLADLALEVSDIVEGDDNELPTFVAHDIEEIHLGGVPGQSAEVDLSVFPLRHFAEFQDATGSCFG